MEGGRGGVERERREGLRENIQSRCGNGVKGTEVNERPLYHGHHRPRAILLLFIISRHLVCSIPLLNK